MSEDYVSTGKTTNKIRDAVKAAFPNARGTVASTYSNATSVDLEWMEDGLVVMVTIATCRPEFLEHFRELQELAAQHPANRRLYEDLMARTTDA